MVKPRQSRPDAEREADQVSARSMAPSDSDALHLLHTTLNGHSKQFQCILHAIQDTKNTLETKIDTVALGVGVLRTDHRNLADRVLN